MFRISSLPDRVLAYQLYDDYVDGATYRYYLDGCFKGETNATDFTFSGLKPNTSYSIAIDVLSGGVLLRHEEHQVSTRAVKRVIRLSPAPKGEWSTSLLQNAFDAVEEGDEIVLSKGVYHSGALFLKSHTCLKLEEGAKILGSSNPDDYPLIPSRFEGIEMMCYASLINVGKIDHTSGPTTFDICIYGEGAIEGGWNKLANAIVDRHIDEFKDRGDFARQEAGRLRGRLIQFNNVDGIILEGLWLGNSPSWNVHPIYSSNLVTANCCIRSWDIWNGDGWDPDSSEHCYIFHTHFGTGDDCVAIKSGKNPEGNVFGRRCTDIQVFDCDSEYGHALAIGSEMSGGVEGVRFFDDNFISTMWGLQIKGTMKRGSYVNDVIAKNSSFGCIKIWSVPYNDDGIAAPQPPTFMNFEFDNITLDGLRHNVNGTTEEVPPVMVSGFKSAPERFRNMTFKNIRCTREGAKNVFEYAVGIRYNDENVIPRRVDFDAFHDHLVEQASPKMAFRKGTDFLTYQKKLRAKFVELLCIDKIKENACPVTLNIEWTREHEDYSITRFTVETEKDNSVPCLLLLPKLGKKKYPLCITLQGHADGMHISGGETNDLPGDDKPNGHFGVQAVKEGYAALCIELRGRGEQRAFRPFRRWDNGDQCKFAAFTALTLGRVLEGERVWDVSRILDVMNQFEAVDMDDVMITGVSGGGTLSFYAACYDERIKLSAPDCAFCPYEESILSMYHCVCNYIPHSLEWFDMQDLSALIAPRKLLALNGKLDRIFPIDAARRGFKTAQAIYEAAGASSHVAMVETPKDHYWCEDMVWPAIKEMRKVK